MQKVLLKNGRLVTLAAAASGYGLVDVGAIAVADGRIQWVGAADQVPHSWRHVPVDDLGGRLVTPAFVDCHTHIVFGGHRAREFEMRLEGASYEEIARAGGGIASTVAATRAQSDSQLLAAALRRVDALIAEGVSLIEIKSGYGLDHDTELKCLRIARQIAKLRPVRIRTTFLGAHAIPPEFKGRADAYIDSVCLPTLVRAAEENLVDAVDGFCEGIAFSPAQIARVFDAARQLNLPVKLHAEQLSNLHGAALAARYGALSADHLEYLDEDGVKAMAASGTVGVLLPGAFYFIRETKVPPVDLLRRHKVPIALATDCNPGSSPLTSLLLTMNMAATLFRMTPEEALRAVTCHAARALGASDTGTITAGGRADLAIWDVEDPAELTYRIGYNPLSRRIFGGVDAA